MKKTLAFRIIGDSSIMMHTNATPADDEWRVWLTAACEARIRRSFVFTPGAGPTALQRKVMNEQATAYGMKTRAAIVTESAIVRGMATAIAWLRAFEIRAFSPDQISEALAYLDLSRTEQAVRQVLKELEAELESANKELSKAL